LQNSPLIRERVTTGQYDGDNQLRFSVGYIGRPPDSVNVQAAAAIENLAKTPIFRTEQQDRLRASVQVSGRSISVKILLDASLSRWRGVVSPEEGGIDNPAQEDLLPHMPKKYY